MSVDLHRASVPVCLRYLERLRGLLDVAEAHASSRGLAPAELLDARLAPDMLPFATQVEVAAQFTLRACFPLAGRAVPPDAEFPLTFDGLRATIARAASLLASLDPAQFDGSASRVLESRAGDALVALEAPEFLLQYALPNFFFHVTTAYAILRHRGVPVGKARFDGFHSYPPTH